MAFPKFARLLFKASLFLVFCSMVVFYFKEKIPYIQKKHIISATDIEFENALASVDKSHIDKYGFLNPVEAAKYCGAHNWHVFPERSQKRKIYDLVMVNSELDWLEIRLNELHKHVDYFVILESATTFTGHSKPLVYLENASKFSAFQSQIIHHILEDPPTSNRTWDHETHQRNAMYSQVLPRLKNEQAPNLGDIILVSDLDEIPRPATLTLLHNCDFPLRLTLRSKFYYYSFQWLHRGTEWAYPQATTYLGSNLTILPQDLRRSLNAPMFSADKADLWNAAWHCSSCFRTIEEMLLKMGSFSHVEYNEERFRSKEYIVGKIRKGKDLWGRFGQWYWRVDANRDVPSYVMENKERFMYMIDRDGESAGFVDYVPPGKR